MTSNPPLLHCHQSHPSDIYFVHLYASNMYQMSIEVNSWPYNFPQSEDFPNSDRRGTVSGQLLVGDK
jgi:hypothetical protein